jgi:hypothetical protein
LQLQFDLVDLQFVQEPQRVFLCRGSGFSLAGLQQIFCLVA